MVTLDGRGHSLARDLRHLLGGEAEFGEQVSGVGLPDSWSSSAVSPSTRVSNKSEIPA